MNGKEAVHGLTFEFIIWIRIGIEWMNENILLKLHRIIKYFGMCFLIEKLVRIGIVDEFKFISCTFNTGLEYFFVKNQE